MSNDRTDPTPAAIRDALGLVRLVYAARSARGGSLDVLRAIGQQLATALARLQRAEDEGGRAAARQLATEALATFRDEITLGDSVLNLAREAEARVSGRTVPGERASRRGR